MATAFSHVVVATAIGVTMGRPVAGPRVLAVGAACAAYGRRRPGSGLTADG